ncbi:MAG: DUF1501 domain-containing protein [Planctomycetia bacterium]|nr:DUF1501 domain-containing protein [Planctomycetia bacterium]
MKTSRRKFLAEASLGVLGLPAIGDLFYQTALGQEPAAPKAKKLGKAKSIIQIWMWGGPSQLETFDPKPDAGAEYCGKWNSPIKTNAGWMISESLPQIATIADMYTPIRSVTHNDFGHETAAYKMQTGLTPGGNLVYPAIGAIVSTMKGYKYGGYDSAIPPYIVLTQPLGRFSECGYLGTNYKPYATGSDPNAKRFLASGFILDGVDEERQASRLELLDSIDVFGKASKINPVISDLEKARQEAYGVLTGAEVKTFDLSEETDETREAYGLTTFGQSCLMARRLVEKGVPFITINYGGWDTHGKHFETLTRNQPVWDKALTFLFKDLRDRNLLDSTIIWWGGEFGRTPRIDYNAPWFGGRGHYGTCFSHMVGGGGFKGGLVVGESNKGETVAKRPVQPQDLLGTLLMQMGIDPDAPLPNDKGFELPTMAPASEEGLLLELV